MPVEDMNSTIQYTVSIISCTSQPEKGLIMRSITTYVIMQFCFYTSRIFFQVEQTGKPSEFSLTNTNRIWLSFGLSTYGKCLGQIVVYISPVTAWE